MAFLPKKDISEIICLNVKEVSPTTKGMKNGYASISTSDSDHRPFVGPAAGARILGHLEPLQVR